MAGLLLAQALIGCTGGGDTEPAAAPAEPGPVLLVPGYGGSTVGLESLAGTLRAAGREARVVALPGTGTGDLRDSAEAVAAAAGDARSVDVVGYSAGGLVARLWAREAPDRVRRVVTLGSPHHGTELAAAGAAFQPGSCPAACLQMVPGSELLDELNDGDETPDGVEWASLWTEQDTVVTPPATSRLAGAVNVALEDLCPGLAVDHNSLPTHPVVQSLVLQALSGDELRQPVACPA